ncbi:MAG: response regulator transcription factor [Bacteroidales bacterium]|nr:response regulator transcription factor [Bacteroidales bacterium]
MIRIFAIEDHFVTSAGLRSLFRPSRDGIEVSGSSTKLEETLEMADPSKTDLFLLDLWLQNTDPVRNIKMLHEKFPGKPVVVLTSEESTIWQRRMMEAGAMGYLIKTASRAEIKLALEQVMQGKAVFSIAVETYHDDRGFTSKSVGLSNSLSHHQHDLLKLLIEGIPQQEMAGRLGISLSTVEKSLKNLRHKLEVKNNAELIRLVSVNRLV